MNQRERRHHENSVAVGLHHGHRHGVIKKPVAQLVVLCAADEKDESGHRHQIEKRGGLRFLREKDVQRIDRQHQRGDPRSMAWQPSAAHQIKQCRCSHSRQKRQEPRRPQFPTDGRHQAQKNEIGGWGKIRKLRVKVGTQTAMGEGEPHDFFEPG